MEITGIFTALIIGAVVGALGRLVLPGRQRIAIWLTIVIGIVAALVGTLLAGLLGVADTPRHRLDRVGAAGRAGRRGCRRGRRLHHPPQELTRRPSPVPAPATARPAGANPRGPPATDRAKACVRLAHSR